MAKSPAVYHAPHQFEPLLPGPHRLPALQAKAHELALQATQLAHLRMPTELKRLLRSMNSYYTNRIEGQHTRPREIEEALARDFSGDAGLATRQRLALAHIEAEEQLERRFAGPAGANQLYSVAAFQEIHQTLFGLLSAEDLMGLHGEGVSPGQFRQRDVQVGRHVAPQHAHLRALMERWASVYGGVPHGDSALVAMAAAHHRLGWIHPFIDGNGRVMRLHTHLWLTAMGYTGGLWSPLRGFARSRDAYYAHLADADAPRRGDLDGRGNLSEAGLEKWIHYVLDVCLDQVSFMRGLLDLADMKTRIENCLNHEAKVVRSGVRPEACRPLHYLFLSGEQISRGEFKSMMGVSERLGTDIVGALIRRGLLKSDSPQGKVRFGLPQHALQFMFPKLWPEAEVDV